jgi:hypothetical protein
MKNLNIWAMIASKTTFFEWLSISLFYTLFLCRLYIYISTEKRIILFICREQITFCSFLKHDPTMGKVVRNRCLKGPKIWLKIHKEIYNKK